MHGQVNLLTADLNEITNTGDPVEDTIQKATEFQQSAKGNYYPIDEQTARNAHYMVHMSDYKPGSATARYQAAVDEAAALVERRKAATSPYYHGKLDSLLDRYARRLAEWHNAYNRNRASYPSQFISGAGGFDMRKHNKQMAREGSLWQEYNTVEAILHKIKSVGTGPVDLADPYAREMLTDQLQHLQKRLDNGKALNAWYRKHKTFEGFPGLDADEIAKLSANWTDTLQRCPWINKPFPDYELSSLRGKINRVQARIAELDKLQALQATQEATEEHDGFRIVRNAAENRLQIIFDGKPDVDTRQALKSNGFRWSPRNQAWQRQLTDNAERAARRALGLN